MYSVKEERRFTLSAYGHDRRPVFLLVGATLIALLTVVVAELFGEMAALLALLLFFFTVIAIGNYRYGVLIAIVLLPLSSTNLIPREMFGVTGINPLNITLLFSVMSLFLLWSVQSRKIYFPKWPRFFWIYVAALVLAAFHGTFYVSSIPSYFKTLEVINFDTINGYFLDSFLKPMIMVFTAFMLSIVIRNSRRPTLYLIPLFFSTIVLPIAVITYVTMSGEPLSYLASSNATARGFLSVIGMHANELGLMFNTAFALSLFCFFSASGFLEKWTLGVATIILTAAIALTFSRGAYLGYLAVVGYLLFTQRRFRTMLVVLLLATVAVFLMPDAVTERAATGLASGNIDGISAGRVDNIWLPLLPDFFSSPLVGHGLNSILWSGAAQHRAILPVGHPHSAYLGALLDFGFFGSIIIFLFFRHMWHVFMTLAKHASEPIWRGFFSGGMACILLLLVQGLTDDSFTPSRTQPFLWLAYGMAIGLTARAHRVKSRRQMQNQIAPRLL